MQSSIAADFVPVNEWQREQFKAHGIVKRDPVSVTMAMLLQLEFGAGERTRFGRGPTPWDLNEVVMQESHRFSSNLDAVCTPGGSRL